MIKLPWVEKLAFEEYMEKLFKEMEEEQKKQRQFTMIIHGYENYKRFEKMLDKALKEKLNKYREGKEL